MSEALSNDLWMFSGLEREGGPRVAQVMEAQLGEWCRRVHPVVGGLFSVRSPREPLRVETTAIGQTEQDVVVRIALAGQQSLLGLPGPLLAQDRHGHPV
jgi:hypothetical protein